MNGDPQSALLSRPFWQRLAFGVVATAAAVGALVTGVRVFFDRTAEESFRSEAFEFVLPSRWACQLEETEWVCNPKTPPPHDAIIILVQKLRGPQDSLEAFETHLRTPKESTGSEGEAVRSEVRHLRRTRIRGQDWVDALHLGSELPGFLTRYLTTTTSGRAVLITFSARVEAYDDYARDLERMVQSLVVYESAVH